MTNEEAIIVSKYVGDLTYIDLDSSPKNANKFKLKQEKLNQYIKKHANNDSQSNLCDFFEIEFCGMGLFYFY